MNKIETNTPDNIVEDLEIPEDVLSIEEMDEMMKDEINNKRD